MKNTQKAVMQQALFALVHIWNTTPDDDVLVDNAIATLREALAEPVVEPVTDKENEQFSQDVSNFKGTDPEATMYALEQFLKRRTSPTPPAEVPLLTDERILNCNVKEQLWFAARFGPASSDMSNECIRTHPDFSCHLVNFARAVEQAVRQKAGIK